MKKLKEALKCIIDDSVFVGHLAEVLDLVCSGGRRSYGKIKEIVGDDANEVLVMAVQN